MIAAELFQSTPVKPKSIAIIGGGIASVCVADQIFKQQADSHVHIFCQDSQLASRGSGNKQGAIYPLLQGSKSDIAELYNQCFHFAVEYYHTLMTQGIEFEHQWCGVLQQAFTEELEIRLNKFAKVWPNTCQYINAEHSSKIANLDLPFSSVFYPKGGWLYPQQFCERLIRELHKRFNLNVTMNCSISSLTQDNNCWQLTHNDTQYSEKFEAVIICSGHQANRFEQTRHIPLQPIRGQVSRFHAQNSMSELNTVLCHNGYVTPSQGQYQSFGATFNKGETNEISRAEDNSTNFRQLTSIYQKQDWAKSLNENDVIGDKAAIRATSIDHTPIAGQVYSEQWVRTFVDQNNGNLKRQYKLKNESQNYEDSDLSGLFIMTGLGARGLTTAPLIAKHLVSSMFGLPSPFNDRIKKAISAMRFQVRQLKRDKDKR